MVWRLGEYLLVERLNQGGMADVYLAKQFGLGGTDQLVALKCIRPDIAEDPQFIRMFVDEAKLAVQLHHANVARTYDLGHIGNTYFMAMEVIEGRDLRALIERARARGLEIREPLALHILAAVCDGLDYAHRKADPTGVPLNIVHRDVSPQNVLVSYAGEVKLIDFGIAKAATHASLSQAGVLKGKYGYMSPEQVRGQAVDHRSDIFATGVVMWELLTCERLFAGSSDFSVLEKVRQVEIIPPSIVSPAISPEVEAVIMKALARDPDDRYVSASDMRDAVLAVMLRRYGPQSPRELATLMQTLFESERQEETGRLENARRIRSIPDDAVSLADESSKPGAAKSEPAQPPDAAPAVTPTPEEHGATVPSAPPPAPPLVATPMPEGIPTRSLSPPGRSSAKDSAKLQTAIADDSVVLAADEATPTTFPRRAFAPAPGAGRPTEIRRAFGHSGRGRDLAIILAALAAAGGLVLGTWLFTRPLETAVKGGVIITSAPSAAQVAVDGVFVGTTPYSSGNIPAGAHEITLDKPGFVSHVEHVKVVANKVVEIKVDLAGRP
ncbi:MAG: serine/threonine protein kinase [Deltaproteobacteria bacterium]|nr:serine/threonine protein kinase [Deltaproteobacteria bacterium]